MSRRRALAFGNSPNLVRRRGQPARRRDLLAFGHRLIAIRISSSLFAPRSMKVAKGMGSVRSEFGGLLDPRSGQRKFDLPQRLRQDRIADLSKHSVAALHIAGLDKYVQDLATRASKRTRVLKRVLCTSESLAESAKSSARRIRHDETPWTEIASRTPPQPAFFGDLRGDVA